MTGHRDMTDGWRRGKTASASLSAMLAVTALSSEAAAQALTDAPPQTPGAMAAAGNWDSAKLYGAASITDHDRKAFLPDGIRLGTFMVSPELSTTTIFNDNILLTPRKTEADLRIDVEPTVHVTSQLPRHTLNFGFGGRLSRYLNNSNFDHENAFAYVDGALHIDHGNILFAKLGSRLMHADSINALIFNPPGEFTPVWTNQAILGFARDTGRLHGSISTSFENWNFYDVTAVDGTVIDQDKHDISIYTTKLTTKYRFSPGYTGVLEARYIRHDTSEQASPIGNLDSDGYQVLAGITAEINPLLRTSFLAGYAYRTYDHGLIGDASSFQLEASLEWLATQNMTIKATARHGLADTPLQSDLLNYANLASVQSSVTLGVDYEVLRNLVLRAGASYNIYDELDSPRTDDIWSARIGVDYYHTKNWLFSLAYEHQLRHSTADAEDISRNRIWATAKLRF